VKLELDTAGDLQRISLECGSVFKFLEVLNADANLPRRQDQTCSETESVDPIVSGGLLRSDIRSGLVRQLPLLIAHQSQLQVQIALQWQDVCQRIIEVKGVAWMNLRALLEGVDLVHLERRN